MIISTIVLIGCQVERKKIDCSSYTDTIYYDNGLVKEIIAYRDSLRDGIYKKYYPNGQIEVIGQNLYGKEVGKFAFYDSLGNIEGERFLKLIHEDHPYHEWDESLDSIDTENKLSVINCQVSYNLEGSIDSTNSFFFQYWGTDTISLGDSLTLKVDVVVPYFKNGKSEYIFTATLPDYQDTVLYRVTNTPYTEYRYKPLKKGIGKIFFSMIQHELENDQKFSYQQSFKYFVK